MLSLKDIMVIYFGFCTPLLVQYNLNIGIALTSTFELNNAMQIQLSMLVLYITLFLFVTIYGPFKMVRLSFITDILKCNSFD